MKSIVAFNSWVRCCSGAALAFAMTGCSLLDDFGQFQVLQATHDWEVTVRPTKVCRNDRLQVRYRIANECPSGYMCNTFYPSITMVAPTQPGLFSGMPVRSMAYSGNFSSTGSIMTAAPFGVRVSSNMATVWYRLAADEMMRMPRVPGRAGDLKLARTAPVEVTVSPLALAVGQTAPRGAPNENFVGYCGNGSPAWHPINQVIGDGRSSRVRVTHICNRDTLRRSVRFMFNFAREEGGSYVPSGNSQVSDPMAFNECIGLNPETPNTILYNIGVSTMDNGVDARGNPLPPAQCPRGSMTGMQSEEPPANIAAEIVYGCAE